MPVLHISSGLQSGAMHQSIRALDSPNFFSRPLSNSLSSQNALQAESLLHAVMMMSNKSKKPGYFSCVFFTLNYQMNHPFLQYEANLSALRGIGRSS